MTEHELSLQVALSLQVVVHRKDNQSKVWVFESNQTGRSGYEIWLPSLSSE